MSDNQVIDKEVVAFSIRLPRSLSDMIRESETESSLVESGDSLASGTSAVAPECDGENSRAPMTPKTSTIKEKDTTVVSVRMPRTLKNELQRLAEENRRSLNQQILWLIERELEIQSPADTPPAN